MSFKICSPEIGRSINIYNKFMGVGLEMIIIFDFFI